MEKVIFDCFYFAEEISVCSLGFVYCFIYLRFHLHLTDCRDFIGHLYLLCVDLLIQFSNCNKTEKNSSNPATLFFIRFLNKYKTSFKILFNSNYLL